MISIIKTYIKNQTSPFCILVGLLLSHNIMGFLPHFSGILYFIYFASIFYIFHNNYKLDFKFIYLLFLIYIPLNIFLANPKEVYQSWSRFFLFSLVILAFSDINKTEKAKIFRQQVLAVLLPIMVVLSIGSFFAYFLGINLFVRNEIEYEATIGGTFSGLTNHSMVLGPISAISMIWLSYLATKTKKRWIWILVIICAGSVLFASSRTALIGAIISITAMMYYITENKKLFIKRLGLVVLLGIITFPIWEFAIIGITNKNSYNDIGEFGSRTSVWRQRISDFSDSPIYGVGFCAENNKNINSNGTIEPGSSWLAILSMTGIIGLCFFVTIIIKAYKNCLNGSNDWYLFGILIFFSIHWITEGYILAGGSFMCVLSWLIIACCSESD